MLRRRARGHRRARGVGACDRSRGERRRLARPGPARTDPPARRGALASLGGVRAPRGKGGLSARCVLGGELRRDRGGRGARVRRAARSGGDRAPEGARDGYSHAGGRERRRRRRGDFRERMALLRDRILPRRRNRDRQRHRRERADRPPAGGCGVSGVLGCDRTRSAAEGPRFALPRHGRRGDRRDGRRRDHGRGRPGTRRRRPPGIGGTRFPSRACPPPRTPVRSYAVSAIDVDIPLNRWGGHVPDASMYVLDSRLPAVRAQERAPLPDRVSTGLRGDPIQPLVLRANSGDCLVVSFTNRAREGHAGFHVHGLPSAATRAGAPVLADARARPAETVTYALQVPSGPLSERTYLVQDVGDPARGVQGLFGAIVIEPEGSVYRDPETGGPLERSSWDAIIHVRDGHDFREFVLVYHQLANALAVNYRSEDFRSRFEAGGVDEANAYSSYEYGDPATPILRSYLGERTVLRVAHGAGDAYYVHHLHGNSILWRQASRVRPSAVAFGWLEQPMLPRAPPPENSSGRSARAAGSDDEEPEHMWVQIDALTFSPGQTHDARIACGAGGCQRAAGDFLYHSHVPQHAERGMWGLWRVFDTFQADLAALPDAEVPPRAVTSTGLLGRVIEGKKVVRAGHLRDPAAEHSIDDLVESQLPPRGERLDARDATVWDWRRIDAPEGPVYLGELDTTDDSANFRSPSPGRRLPILFNPTTGRYAWPPFRPHLGKRPPFSARHTGAPWLGEVATSVRPDGVCPATELLRGPDRKTRVFSVAARRGDVLGASSSVSYETHGKPRLIE